MPSRLFAALFAALVLAVPAGGALSATTPAPANAIPGPPTGLRAFLLSSNEAASNTFSRTPSFVWSPVKGTLSYEFQLGTNPDVGDSEIVWTSASLTTPYTSLPVSLPWMTGGPSINGLPSYALYARVRAITQAGATEWSNPFGFNMRGSTPTTLDPQFPGLVRWTPVDGATSYDVWFTDGSINKTISTISNVADEREWYTFNRAPAGWDHVLHWRVRAVRRLFGAPLANGLPQVSYGPWSPFFNSAVVIPPTGTLGPLATVSDKVTPDGTTNPHAIVPGYTYTPLPLDPTSSIQRLYRVVVATDDQCVNVVFRGSIVGGPAYAPRLTGPLSLPLTSPLTVTVNQAPFQADPTASPTINFTVIFSDVVTDFTDADVALSGTAAATTATVTGSGTTYNVAVTGMSAPGTVVVSVPKGGAHDPNGNANVDSTTSDNSVTFDPTTTLLGTGGPTGITGPTGPFVLSDGPQTNTYGPDGPTLTDSEELSGSSAAAAPGTTGPTGPTGATGATGASPLPSDFATTGAQIDLWDNSSLTSASSQTGRYYWTVVPVGQITLLPSNTLVYAERTTPQDECAAVPPGTFGKMGTPATSFANGLPYATGLDPNGTIVNVSVPDPTFYGPPLAAWEPMSGATGYEVQWSKTLEPWQTEGTPILTASTSTLIPGLTPGTWYYRVRGLDPFLPGPFQRTAWSRPIHINIAPSTFQVTAVAPTAPKTKPVAPKKAKPVVKKVPKAKIPQGFASFNGWAKDFSLALPKTWHAVPRTSPLVQNSMKQGGFALRFVAFDPKSKGGYVTNLSILKGPGRGSTSFADWTQAELAGIKSSLTTSSAAVAYHVAYLPAGRALEIEYPVAQGGRTVWLIQYLVDGGSTTYALTFATLSGHQASYRAKFVSAARSFRIRASR